jgi:tetratricopeptide (TPR) repeat protein
MGKRRQAVGADPLAGIDSERLATLLGEEGEPDPNDAVRSYAPPVPEPTSPAPSEASPPFGEAAVHPAAVHSATVVGEPRSTREEILRLADYHAARADHRAAAELLAPPHDDTPDDIGISIRLARAYGRLTAYAEAEAILQRALKIEPRNAEAHCEMGIVLAKRGVCASAIEELRRALDLDPELARGYYHLGVCYNQLDRLDEAVEALKRAIALDPESDRACYHLGIVYDRLAMGGDARAMYRRSREITDARARG